MTQEHSSTPGRSRRAGRRAAAAVAGTSALAVLAVPLAHAGPTDLADLSAEVTQSADTVGVFEPVTYTVRVANAGPSAATGVSLTDVVVDKSEAAAGPPPANITPTQGAHINSATPSQGTCVIDNNANGFGGTKVGRGYPNKVTCDFGTLASGATATVDIEVSPNLNTFVVIQDQGVIADVATVSADPAGSTDPDPSDNTDSVTTSVVRS